MLWTVQVSFVVTVIGFHAAYILSDDVTTLCVQFLGLHSDNEHSQHNQGAEIPDYTYKMLVVMAGIYYFYLMETIFSVITYRNDHHDHHAVRKTKNYIHTPKLCC